MADIANKTPSNPRMEAAQRFGKFYLVRRLAEGGMAEIFLAKQVGPEGFERNVVIKRMLPSLTADPTFVNMFLDEARLAARMSHPNIVQIHELGLQDGSYYICMEYLAGEDFSAVMRAARRIKNEMVPLHITARVMLEAAHGLQFAHDFTDDTGQPLNVVHRDVSPSNIFCTYQGQVKLLDFGISRARSHVQQTAAGTFKGKYLYMAPEQVAAKEVDRRTDVFALGICLYEAVTGMRPFAREQLIDTFDAVANVDFKRPREVRPDLPEEIEAIIYRALAKEPGQRYPTAAAMGADLEKFLAGQSDGSGRDALANYLTGLFGDDRVQQKMRIPSLAHLAQSGVYVPGFTSPGIKLPEPQAAIASAARSRRKSLAKALKKLPPSALYAGIGFASALVVLVLGLLVLRPGRPSPRPPPPVAVIAPIVAPSAGMDAGATPVAASDSPAATLADAGVTDQAGHRFAALDLTGTRAATPHASLKPKRNGAIAKPARKPKPDADDDAALPAPSEPKETPPPPPRPPPDDGELTDSEIQQVIASGRPEILQCFQTFKDQLQREEGRVTVRLTILEDGSVRDATVKGELSGTAAGRCIEYRVKALSFPRSKERITLETAFAYRARK